MNRIWLIALVATSASVLVTACAMPAAQPIKIDLMQWARPDIATIGGDPFGKLVGAGTLQIKEPARAADPDRGAQAYFRVCAACHGANGLGQMGRAISFRRSGDPTVSTTAPG